MKKFFTILLIIFSSSCSILPITAGILDPTILNPISGLLYTQSGGLSYIFFAKEQTVLIKNESISNNNYYKLSEGSSSSGNIFSYKLKGEGTYNNNYLAILLRGDNAGISVQQNRNFAINAVRSISSVLTVGEKLKSPVLYTIAALGPIVKTSLAGTFDPDVNEYSLFTFDNIDLTSGVNLTKVTVKDDGTLNEDPIDLTFRTNLSDNATVFTYSTKDGLTLLGVIIDFNNRFPRLQIIEETYPTVTAANVALFNFSKGVVNNSIWEYSLLNTIRVSDGGLDDFQGKLWIEHLPGQRDKYDPLVTTKWDIDSDTLNISKTTDKEFTEEEYLLALTDITGTYLLLDHQATDPQEFSDKYFRITANTDKNSTIQIANTINGFQNPGYSVSVSIGLDPLPIKFTSPLTINNPRLGTNASANSIAGRSAFHAFVDSTDTIYLVGGFTNSGRLFSRIPQVAVADDPLQSIYNEVWTIKNILTSPDYKSTGEPLNMEKDVDKVGFQQLIGANTSTKINDSFWVFGAGANATDLPPINRFSYNTSSQQKWVSRPLGEKNFKEKNHQFMVSHNDQLYIMGGTKGPAGDLGVGGVDPTVYGEHLNEIYMAPNQRESISQDNWELLTPPTSAPAIWSPRIHSRVFSVGKTIVLVGGMKSVGTPSTDSTTPPTPVNDVWRSDNAGTNWTEIVVTSSVTPPKQTAITQGALIGTVHNGIIYLLDPARKISYSFDKGETWFEEGGTAFPGGALYGASLVVIDNTLILIGGQTRTISGSGGMESKIYTVKIGT